MSDNKRTQKLAVVFVGVLALVVIARGVWPAWIAPLLDTEGTIARLDEELGELNAFEQRFMDAALKYKGFVSRVGATDAGVVRDELHSRLIAMIRDHELGDWRLTPRNPAVNRKTGWTALGFTVSGEAPLKNVLEFLKELYELPQVVRIVDPRVVDATSLREKNRDNVKLSAGIEAIVLNGVIPTFKEPLKAEDLSQPDTFVRHRDVDIQLVSAAKPFMEYEKPPKPPPPPPPPPPKEKEKVVAPPPPPPPKYRWDGNWRLVGTSKKHAGADNEVSLALVEEEGGRGGQKRKFVSTGEDFDGGKLLAVQPRAALVRREDGEFVYPLGELFVSAMTLDQAGADPLLTRALETFRQELAPEEEPGLTPDGRRGRNSTDAGSQETRPGAPSSSSAGVGGNPQAAPPESPSAGGGDPAPSPTPFEGIDLSPLESLIEKQAAKVDAEKAGAASGGDVSGGPPPDGTDDANEADEADAKTSDPSAGKTNAGESDSPTRNAEKAGKTESSGPDGGIRKAGADSHSDPAVPSGPSGEKDAAPKSEKSGKGAKSGKGGKDDKSPVGKPAGEKFPDDKKDGKGG